MSEEASESDGSRIEREECGTCNGTGEVVDEAYERTGITSCPDCDNVPKSAVPNDPPEDPHARLAEIEEELEGLEAEEEEIKEGRELADETTDGLTQMADLDVVNDETAAVLSHLSRQIRDVSRRAFDDRHIAHKRDGLRREQAELQRYIDCLEDSDNNS
jgi:hypothetical protein